MPRPKGRRPGETQEQALARIMRKIEEREAAAEARRRQRRPTGAAGPTGRQHQFKTRAEYDETDRRREEWRAEQARKRAHREKYGSALGGHRTTGSRGHGTSFRENYIIDSIIDYLIDEGYVYDEKSAIAILEAMSDSWLDEVLSEGVGMEASRFVASLLAPRGSTPQDINAGAQRIYNAGAGAVKAAGRVLSPLVTPGPRANPSELINRRRPSVRDRARMAGH